jgi:triacylglycerol lipase
MLARLLQVATLGLLLLAVMSGVALWRAGKPVWAVAAAALILFAYAGILAAEFAMLGWANRSDPVPPARLNQLVSAWWGEVLSGAQVFCWRQPFRANAEPDFLCQSESHGVSRRGVVLVHGFMCNRGLWNPLMRRLRALGIPFIAVNLEPVLGSLDDYPPVIERAVQRMDEVTGCPPVMVAHSMGGLAVRLWLQRQEADARVHRVITIASPHRGTLFGRLGIFPNARQMRLSSSWQQKLCAEEPLQRFQRFTCFYGHCDNIVLPASSATLPGADNRHLAGCAHVQMAYHEAVFNEVLRWVTMPRASADEVLAARQPGMRTTHASSR